MNVFDVNKPKNKLEFVESHTDVKGYFPCHTMMKNMIHDNGFYKFSGQHNINVKDMKQKEKDTISLLTKNDNCFGFNECYYSHQSDTNLPPEYVLLKCFCCEHGCAELEREKLSALQRSKEIRNLNKINNSNGFVYFIRSELSGNTKIGKTSNLSARFSNIKMCDPSVTLLFAIRAENQHTLEKDIQFFFDTKRKVGEWFLLSTKDISYVRNRYKENLVESI